MTYIFRVGVVPFSLDSHLTCPPCGRFRESSSGSTRRRRGRSLVGFPTPYPPSLPLLIHPILCLLNSSNFLTQSPGLKGWVMNTDAGTVVGEAQGNTKNLEDFERCRPYHSHSTTRRRKHSPERQRTSWRSSAVDSVAGGLGRRGARRAVSTSWTSPTEASRSKARCRDSPCESKGGSTYGGSWRIPGETGFGSLQGLMVRTRTTWWASSSYGAQPTKGAITTSL